MPVVGVRCPVKQGKEYIQTIPSCLTCAAEDAPCQFTQAVLLAMFAQEQRTGVHVSDLLTCPRQAILRKKINYTVDPLNQWHLLRGKMAHLMLESATKGINATKDIEEIIKKSPEVKSELTLQLNIDGTILTGTIDEYIQELGLIRDYKSVKKIPPWKYPYKHHKDQINIYSVLLEKNKYPVKRGQIVYFDMADSKKVDCPILPMEERIEFIKTRMSYYTSSEADINNSVTMREWHCLFCDPEIVTECMKIDLLNSLKEANISQEETDNILHKFQEVRRLHG